MDLWLSDLSTLHPGHFFIIVISIVIIIAKSYLLFPKMKIKRKIIKKSSGNGPSDVN